MPLCLASNKQWYRSGNMFPTVFASQEKSKTIVACRHADTAAAARRRRKSHKEQHEPFMFLAFHIVIVHPSSALEAVHVVSRLAAEVLRRLWMMLHAEALRLAYVHTADHAAHVGV
jgi:hypothetical protein